MAKCILQDGFRANTLPILLVWMVCFVDWSYGKVPTNTTAVRIFAGAPRGTTIYEIPAEYLSSSPIAAHAPGRRVRLLLTGPDRQHFQLSEYAVKVDEYPRLSRSVGERYVVTIAITTDDNTFQPLAEITLKVLVSVKNQHVPYFARDSYVAEVFRYEVTRQRILQVDAKDDDAVQYNRDLSFALLNRHSTPAPVGIHSRDGTLYTLEEMKNAEEVFTVTAIVVDGGSPQLSNRTNITIYVREISEPINITLSIHNETAADVCWRRPRHGRVKRYEVDYGSVERPGESEKRLVNRRLDKRPCQRLSALQPKVENWVSIRALGSADVMGMAAKIYFHVDTKGCGGRKCVDGKCYTIESPLQCGERRSDDLHDLCDCDDGEYTGNHVCESYCREQNLFCRNGGTPQIAPDGTRCVCLRGFYGKNCQHYNPCTEIVCQNGGTCRNLSSADYICICAQGFSGDVCQDQDSCYSGPCKNGGACRSTGDEDYECTCYFGFYGKECSRYDPCFSAPCQNNGICKNITDYEYTCRCQPGFHGEDCQLYSPCLYDPCLYGGFCNSIDGQFVCECTFGRFGRKCEHLNLCQLMDPCGENAVNCHNLSDTSYKCVCKPGWSGANCTEFDPCFGSPCQNEGRCIVTSKTDYRCECRGMYYGTKCERVNLCHSNPCKNSAECINMSNWEYKCQCATGYYGHNCEHYNPCSKARCEHDSPCINTSATEYKCLCQQPYFGDYCQHFNSCYANPCKHGECHPDIETGKHTCKCRPGWSGPECQHYNPCATQPCQNAGTCIHLGEERYQCTCRGKYYGVNCEHYDSCHSNPCTFGSCMNLAGGNYYCACPQGKFGRTCSSTDPCADEPCKHGGSCEVLQGNIYRCVCAKGHYGLHCENYNPCLYSPCKNNGLCEHLSGDKFSCRCQPRFQGLTCEEEIPCNPHQGRVCFNNGTCRFENNSYYCECQHGFHGYRCQGYNPCAYMDTCTNGGKCIAKDNHQFMCDCPSGFFGERCEFHKPCDDYTCRNNGTCVQTNTGNRCFCSEGFEGDLCEVDLDECQSNPCEEHSTCVDRPGGFKCNCAIGYKGVTCNKPEACRTDVTYESRGTYVWPMTPHGMTTSIECARTPGKYASRRCVLRRNGEAHWGETNTMACDLRVQGSVDARHALHPFKQVNESLTSPRQVAAAVELLEAIVDLACRDQQVASDMIDVIDQLLALAPEVLAASNTTHRIMTVIEKFMADVQWSEGQGITLTRKHIAIHVQLATWIQHSSGASFTPEAGELVASIQVAKEIFNEQNIKRVKFLFMDNSKLFLNKKDEAVDVGMVISVELDDIILEDINPCVLYKLPNIQGLESPRCVFWDTEEMTWQSRGIRRVSYTSSEITCCSSHLTHFAVSKMLDVTASSLSVEGSYMVWGANGGTIISVLTLAVVLLTYSIFRSLNSENLGQLVIQMTLCLMFWHVCTLVGLSRNQLDNDIVCQAVAILSHYFVLASFLWIIQLGQYIHAMLVREYAVQNPKFIFIRCILAYGLPLILVGVSAGVDFNGYQQHPDSCILSSANRYIYCTTYLTPLILAAIGCIILTVFLARAAHGSTFHKRKGTPIAEPQVYTILLTLPIVTISWMCGYIASLLPEDQASYMLIIKFCLYGCTGCLLFIGLFLLKPEARDTWNQCFRGHGLGSRRRIAGKSSSVPTTASSATSKGESGSDYTLVVDRGLTEKEPSFQKTTTKGANQQQYLQSPRVVTLPPEELPQTTIPSSSFRQSNNSMYPNEHRNSTASRLSADSLRRKRSLTSQTDLEDDLYFNSDHDTSVQSFRTRPSVSDNSYYQHQYRSSNVENSKQYATMLPAESTGSGYYSSPHRYHNRPRPPPPSPKSFSKPANDGGNSSGGSWVRNRSII